MSSKRARTIDNLDQIYAEKVQVPVGSISDLVVNTLTVNNNAQIGNLKCLQQLKFTATGSLTQQLAFRPADTGNTYYLGSITTPQNNIFARIPDVSTGAGDVNCDFVMTQGNQSISGNKTFLGSISCASLNSGNGRGIRFYQPSSNGAFIDILPATSINTVKVFTVPDVADGADFVMAEGDQTINGTKIFATGISAGFLFSKNGSGIRLYQASNSSYVGINPATSISTTRNFNVPDVPDGANFVMSEGDQTINGVYTFTNGVKFGDGGSVLVDFEEFSGSYDHLDWGVASSSAVPYRIQRSGTKVSMFIPGFTLVTTPTNDSTIVSTGDPLPSRFLPAASYSGKTITYINSTFSYKMNDTGGPLKGSVFMLASDGSLQLYSSDGGKFTGTIFEFYSIALEWFTT